jgi:hypothetical protein
MPPFGSCVGQLDGIQLSLDGLIKHLCVQGRFEALVREALAAQLVQSEARQAGISVKVDELQAAANEFRRRHRLNRAADTRSWLAAQNLTVDDFEAGLKQTLLAAKLRQHLTAANADDHFAAHRADFERLRLTRLLVQREDLARELASQIREEGKELADVARDHGRPLVRGQWFRKEIDEPIASATIGQLVGPFGTSNGFVLAVVEKRRPAELDETTRQRIQDELYQEWLAQRMLGATVDRPVAGVT